MSDAPQGEGWWQASDGKWYPPQPAAPPPAAMPPPTGPPPGMPPPSPYAPPAPPAGAYAGPIGPPPSSGMSGCLKWGLIVGAILFVLGGVGCVVVVVSVDDAVDDAVDDIEFNDAEEVDDVDITDCGRSETGQPEVGLEVTNDSSERSNYIITVTFEDEDNGNQLDTTTAFVNALEPRQLTTVDASGFTDVAGDFDCRIAGVERFSDETGG